ncbi:cysteine-rich receptor-like protein kinase 8 [Tanacetum coccineum]
MMIALNAKNKLKIITNEYPEPDVNSLMRALWERNNDMIISWVLNTVTNQISNNLSFVHSASALWKELHEHYSQLDGHIIYQLTNEITQLRQTNCSIEMYYQKLKGLWDEVDALEAPYMSNPIDATYAAMLRQEEKQKEATTPQFTTPIVMSTFSNSRQIGHPLHGNFKPGNSGQNRTTNFKLRAVNMGNNQKITHGIQSDGLYTSSNQKQV